jgi:hypothetical protein
MTSARTVVITRVALTLRIVVPPSYLRRHLGTLAASLGTDLAMAVGAATREQRLGYFPALDYFVDQPGVNPVLLATATNLARMVRDHVRQEVQHHLAAFFSQVIIRRITSPAYTLPRVSPQQADALEALARHYFPDSVRLDLVVSLVERGPALENPEQAATRRALWNLRDHFERVEVTDARVLET